MMLRFFSILLLCLTASIGLHGQQPSRDIITSNCTLEGVWSQNLEGLGPSTWTIAADGSATESGLGNAKGKASLSGRTLRIDWTIPGYNNSGYYVWTLGDDCKGSGEGVNTVSGARRKSTVAKTITTSSASIRAELIGSPTEVWVGFGRPSMAAGIRVTGFKRNSPDPVVLDCPSATNGFGDHPFAGDRLKTVRIFPCGSNQLTYDWPAGGYDWGIMISAPARDLENDVQPGRPRDICIGTNPVRVRVSQKGAGEAFVTISPQLLLKAGLVGGSGTYGPTKCAGDARTTQPGGGTGGGTGGGSSYSLGKVAIQTAGGRYLTAVRGGGVPGPGAIHSDASKVSGWEIFELIGFSDGKIAIKTASGNYLTAVRGGGLSGPDVIHTDARKIDAWEKFTLKDLGDGTWAIQTATGHYLTAVNGGGVGGGRPAIHTNATAVSAWEKFDMIEVP